MDESVSVTGRFVDAINGRPISGGLIAAGDTSATSDIDGRFSLSLPTGNWTLVVGAAGYMEDSVDVAVSADSPVELEVFLVPQNIFSEHVEVRAEATAVEGTAIVVVEPERVMSVAGSLDNVFRTVATLPGVTATGDFGSRLSVRGGTPDQNLTIMDGVEIHNPYRLFGITSAFNPETVSNFQLTAGGFSAKYGDRLSSLMIVENRDGRPELDGSAALSITDANVIFEGAFPGNTGGSWLFSGRRTYYDLLADRLTGNDLPSFGDLQAKSVWEFGPGHRLSIFGLRSREGSNMDFDGDFPGETALFSSNAGNDLVSVGLEAVLGGRGTSRTIGSWYRNTDFIDFDGTLQARAKRSNSPGDEAIRLNDIAFDREFAVRDVSLRQELAWQIAASHLFETGAEIHALDTAVRFKIDGDRIAEGANGSSVRGGAGLPDELDSTLTGTRGGAWIQDSVDIMSRWTVVPGLRFDWSTANDRTSVSPRFATSFELSPSSTIGAAVGLYTQSPGYEKLMQSDFFIDLTNAAIDLDYEKATHVIVSFEKKLGRGVTARVEGYHKAYDGLVVGRLETEEERLARISRYDFPPELQESVPTEPIITSFPTNDSGGHAYGLDLYVEREARAGDAWSGWISYTLGRAEREAYGQIYPFEYDRPHALSIVGSYRLGPRFDIAVTGRLASGFPRTPVLGLRVSAVEDVDRGEGSGTLPTLVPELDGAGNLVYTVDHGGVENLNRARLPLYIRFDVRGTFRPGGPSGRWEIYWEVINAFNRANALNFQANLTYDPTSDVPQLNEEPSEAFPLLPTFGVRLRF